MMVAGFPRCCLANFPIRSPNMVKVKLVRENIVRARYLFLVIASKPRPVEKASIDTPMANISILRYVKFISLVSFLR